MQTTPGEAEAQPEVFGGIDVEGAPSEATQRPSYATDGQPKKTKTPKIEAERSRLAKFIRVRRARLSALANRLEMAVQDILGRQTRPAILAVEASIPAGEALRQRLHCPLLPLHNHRLMRR